MLSSEIAKISFLNISASCVAEIFRKNQPPPGNLRVTINTFALEQKNLLFQINKNLKKMLLFIVFVFSL